MSQVQPALGGVVRWSAEEGWGVLRSTAVDGLVFAHFSVICDQAGHRGLEPGQQVWFRFETPGQDGCAARATSVWSGGPPVDGAPGPEGPSDAYRSVLHVTVDPPGGSPPPPP